MTMITFAGALTAAAVSACQWDWYEKSVSLEPVPVTLQPGEAREFSLEVRLSLGPDSTVGPGYVTVSVEPDVPSDSGDSDTAAETSATLRGLDLLMTDEYGNGGQADLGGTYGSVEAHFIVCDGESCRDAIEGACDLDGGHTCEIEYAVVLSNESDETFSVMLSVVGTMESSRYPVRDTTMELSFE